MLKEGINDAFLTIMFILRYITTEELEQALHEFGMHDGRDIKEIISEVDADNVSNKRSCFIAYMEATPTQIHLVAKKTEENLKKIWNLTTLSRY